MASARRKRMRAQTKVIDVLLRQLRDDVFPDTVIIHRGGNSLARLIRETDYQEVISLMTEHLKHLADEAQEQAVALDEAIAMLEQMRQERRQQREYSLCMAKTEYWRRPTPVRWIRGYWQSGAREFRASAAGY